MKLAKSKLRQIIREEFEKIIESNGTGEKEGKLAVGIRNAIIDYLQEEYYGGRPLPGDVLRLITNHDPKISNIVEAAGSVQENK